MWSRVHMLRTCMRVWAKVVLAELEKHSDTTLDVPQQLNSHPLSARNFRPGLVTKIRLLLSKIPGFQRQPPLDYRGLQRMLGLNIAGLKMFIPLEAVEEGIASQTDTGTGSCVQSNADSAYHPDCPSQKWYAHGLENEN